MSVLDGPVSVTNPDFTSHLEQRWSGAPFFQAIGGLRGDPDQGPAFMIEFTGAFGLGVERPVALELVAGVEF